jgi:uncharacterized RDD family membrane protein YckC
LTVSGLFRACNTWLAIETGSLRDTVTPVPETASWGRRVLAFFIDWVASSFVAVLLVGPKAVQGANVEILVPPIVLLLEMTFGTTLAGGSFGQLATRLRVVRPDGRGLGPARALARSVMILMVIPPLVFRPDGRGLHDIAVGSCVVPLQVR